MRLETLQSRGFLALLGMLLMLASANAVTARMVTTRLDFLDPVRAGDLAPTRGTIRAVFRARSNRDGTWDLDVTFTPRNFSVFVRNGDIGSDYRPVSGTAVFAAAVQPGAPVSMVASALYYYAGMSNSVLQQLPVYCTFTVDSGGGITVQNLHV